MLEWELKCTFWSSTLRLFFPAAANKSVKIKREEEELQTPVEFITIIIIIECHCSLPRSDKPWLRTPLKRDTVVNSMCVCVCVVQSFSYWAEPCCVFASLVVCYFVSLHCIKFVSTVNLIIQRQMQRMRQVLAVYKRRNGMRQISAQIL